MAKIHEKAEQGFQTAGDAYERGRPEYPADAVAELVKVLRLTPQNRVVELGAGTGKFTKILREHAHITAIEPVEGMRAKFSSLYPNVKILGGTAEEIPLPVASAHAVVAAQAFHWFRGEVALPEIHRVLEPRGRIGLIWNLRDDSLDWVAKLNAIVDAHEGSAPRYVKGDWRKAFDQTKLFTPLSLSHFRYLHSVTPSMIRDRVASTSFISALPEEKKKMVLAEVDDLVAQHPNTRGKGTIDLPYRTDLYWCEKI